MDISNATLVIQQPSPINTLIVAGVGIFGVFLGLSGNVALEFIKNKKEIQSSKINAYGQIRELILSMKRNYDQSIISHILAKEYKCRANLENHFNESKSFERIQWLKAERDEQAKSIRCYEEAAKMQRLLHRKLAVFIITSPNGILKDLIKSVDLIENNILNTYQSINEYEKDFVNVQSNIESGDFRNEAIERFMGATTSEITIQTDNLLSYLENDIRSGSWWKFKMSVSQDDSR